MSPDQQRTRDNTRRSKGESKTSTGRLDGGPYPCTSHISYDNNSGAKKLMLEYDIDETLEIKEEIVEDQEKVPVLNTKFESKVCTKNIREDDTLASDNKLQIPENPKIQDSKLEKKYTCVKCDRTYKHKYNLTYHQNWICQVMPQFKCKYCARQFKRRFNMHSHIEHVHHKTNLRTSELMHNSDKCAEIYSSSRALLYRKSEVQATVKPLLFCDYCAYKTLRKCNLKRHIVCRHFK
ncbi:zinc finger protein 888-like [Belonocnema kinseyi]|uniref:zinc finger protein 888-like n=1 Tax=Belonocnema kinseyi TaxID=2817044 RepID=UPI00143DC10E|nr:zinc finger protein 888-like [Belonocnema kinseyi]